MKKVTTNDQRISAWLCLKEGMGHHNDSNRLVGYRGKSLVGQQEEHSLDCTKIMIVSTSWVSKAMILVCGWKQGQLCANYWR